jgi:mono/diheme cytochrome c family protein
MHGTVSRQSGVNLSSGEGPVPRWWRLATWIAAMLAVVMASPAVPQGNIDAGKTPAQIFADTCSNCHRRPQELKRPSVGFLRQHYTPGAQEAAAMAGFLANVPSDPRAGRDRGKAPAERAPEREKAKPQPQQQAQDRAQERPKVQPTPKAKRPGEVAKSVAVEVPVAASPEPVQEAPPVPKLEPFEE